MISRANRTRHVPFVIAATYAVVSALWIIYSDHLLETIAGNMEAYEDLQHYKGLFFVTVSALLLYVALRSSWKKLDETVGLLDLSSDLARLGGWRTDHATGKLVTSPGIYDAYAMPSGPFSLDLALTCFTPDDRAILAEHRQRVRDNGEECSGEFHITALDGKKKWLRVVQRPQTSADGRVIATIGAVQDISEVVALRHEAEAQARRVWNMVDNMPDGFFLMDRELRFTYANTMAAKIIANAKGTGPEYLGRTLWEVFPRVASQLREPMARLLRDGAPETMVLEVRETNEYRRAVSFITPDGVGTHLRDVTLEMRAQEKLRASEERYRLATLASRDVLFDWDVVNDKLMWSEAARSRYGYDPAVFPARIADWFSRVHPDDRKALMDSTSRAMQLDQPDNWTEHYRLLTADDEVVHVMERGISVRDDKGAILRMVGTITDVTAEHEEQLRLQAVVDVAADAIYEYDPKRNVITMSEGIRTVFGYEWVGELTVPTPWQKAVLAEDRDRVVESFMAFCASLDLRWRCEYRMTRADGRIANIREKVMAMRDDDGQLIRVIGSMEDVTQERRAEERLKQSERIQAIGTLTGGVAHDFNNLLTIMLGNAELLEDDDRLDERSRRLASVIVNAAERGAELTARLLAFTGKQPIAPKAIDARHALAEIARLLERTLPADIALTINAAPDVWMVEADPAQMNAAILNLVTNARDAMPGGGKLEIECENLWVDPAKITAGTGLKAGEYVRIRVTDNGTGMPDDVVEHAFEPFFTTKSRGLGTGLGLSMVHGFVQQSGGFAKIATKPGEGTSISLYLPRSRADRTESGLDATVPTMAGRLEHILVVEDNPLLLPHVKDMVASLGYRVSAAADAEAALALLREHDDIDLLFTDVVLPGEMNGPALARKAVALRPNLKVLFTSGNTENAVFDQVGGGVDIRLLAKPYRRHELAGRLREVIDAAKWEVYRAN